MHLRDYDPEIFDDDDFYHQVIQIGFRKQEVKISSTNEET